MCDVADLPSLFVCTWPSYYGGADTKAADLLELLHQDFQITAVPNFASHLNDRRWTSFLDELQIDYATLDQLPPRLEGVALSLSNERFFASGMCSELKRRGLRIVWSSEMMWHHDGEREAIEQGVVDHLLYVSEVQKTALNYESFCAVPTRMTGNYVAPHRFGFVDRRRPGFCIGRLSRADPLKYPEDFPVFYESLELPDTRFRVMAWDDRLRHKYRWHRFDERWTLLRPTQEESARFLQSLDLYVYPLGHRFTESWGRSTVEAMLTGAIPLVPMGHNFANLIEHGESGFLCEDFRDYQQYAHELYRDEDFRRHLSETAARHARRDLCDRETHRRLWKEVLSDV